jgi:hypothetical protein
MFYLDMKVERSLGTVELLALLIRALVSALDIVGTSTVMLLAARAITLTL